MSGNGFASNSAVRVYVTDFDSIAGTNNNNGNFLSSTPINLAPIAVNLDGNQYRAITTNANGGFMNITPELIWDEPTRGSYNIIIDTNNDGLYTRGVDFIDEIDEPGFRVTELQVGQERSYEGGEIRAAKRARMDASPSHSSVDLFVVDPSTTNLLSNYASSTVSTNANGGFGWTAVWSETYVPNCPANEDCQHEFLLVADNNGNNQHDADDNAVSFIVYKEGEPEPPTPPTIPVPPPTYPIKQPTKTNCVVQTTTVGAATGALGMCLLGVLEPFGWLTGPGKIAEIGLACTAGSVAGGAMVGGLAGAAAGSEVCQNTAFCTGDGMCDIQPPVSGAVYGKGYTFNEGHTVHMMPLP